jgi:hypothetical protein
MPTVKDLLEDPDFQSLSEDDRKTVFGRVFPTDINYMTLSPDDRQQVRNYTIFGEDRPRRPLSRTPEPTGPTGGIDSSSSLEDIDKAALGKKAFAEGANANIAATGELYRRAAAPIAPVTEMLSKAPFNNAGELVKLGEWADDKSREMDKNATDPRAKIAPALLNAAGHITQGAGRLLNSFGEMVDISKPENAAMIPSMILAPEPTAAKFAVQTANQMGDDFHDTVKRVRDGDIRGAAGKAADTLFDAFMVKSMSGAAAGMLKRGAPPPVEAPVEAPPPAPGPEVPLPAEPAAPPPPAPGPEVQMPEEAPAPPPPAPGPEVPPPVAQAPPVAPEPPPAEAPARIVAAKLDNNQIISDPNAKFHSDLVIPEGRTVVDTGVLHPETGEYISGNDLAKIADRTANRTDLTPDEKFKAAFDEQSKQLDEASGAPPKAELLPYEYDSTEGPLAAAVRLKDGTVLRAEDGLGHRGLMANLDPEEAQTAEQGYATRDNKFIDYNRSAKIMAEAMIAKSPPKMGPIRNPEDVRTEAQARIAAEEAPAPAAQPPPPTVEESPPPVEAAPPRPGRSVAEPPPPESPGPFATPNVKAEAPLQTGFMGRVRSIFAPHTQGEQAAEMGRIITRNDAQQQRVSQIERRAVAFWKNHFNHYTEDQTYDYWSKIQEGRLGELTPVEAQYHDIVKSAMDARGAMIQEAAKGPGAKYLDIDFSLKNDYVPMLFRNPTASWMRGAIPKLGGAEGFLEMQKTNMAEAREAGRQPITLNPAINDSIHIRQMDQLQGKLNILNDMESKGFLYHGKDAPAGYARLEGPDIAPDLWAPQTVANVFNNHIDVGVRDAKVYQAVRKIGGGLVMSKLALSAFHATGSLLNASMNNMANALMELDKGDAGKASAMATQTFSKPFEAAKKGQTLLQGYFDPSTLDPQTRQLMELAVRTGTKIERNTYGWESKLRDNLKRELDNKKAIIPAAYADALNRLSVPLMGKLVPGLKLVGVMDGIERGIAQAIKDGNYKGTPVDFLKDPTNGGILDKIGTDVNRSIDNRMGQLNTGMLFWKGFARDTADVTAFSPGWTFGTIMELGGGVTDALKGGAMTQKTAYAMALPIVHVMFASVLQHMLTGKPAQGMDFIAPKTGGKNRDGTDERMWLPDYTRDVAGYANHPLNTMENKESAWIGLTKMILSNRDWRDKKIVDQRGSLQDNLKRVGSAAVQQVIPISLDQALLRNDMSPEMKASAFMGVTKAPAWFTRTRMWQYVFDNSEKSDKYYTPEEDAKFQKILKAADAKKAGEDVDRSQFSPKEWTQVIKYSKREYGQGQFQKLPFPKMFRAWEMASPDEKKEIRPWIGKGFAGSLKNAEGDDRKKIITMMNTIRQYKAPAPSE